MEIINAVGRRKTFVSLLVLDCFVNGIAVEIIINHSLYGNFY
jgi:hypothetical protein